MTLAVEIQEVRTAEELENVRELFRSYRDGLPPHLRFPDADVTQATAAGIEYCDFRLSTCEKTPNETMCPRCSTY